jgi:hypothetical protein
MLLLLILANLVDQSPEPSQPPAQAFVRIERASMGTQAKWEQIEETNAEKFAELMRKAGQSYCA